MHHVSRITFHGSHFHASLFYAFDCVEYCLRQIGVVAVAGFAECWQGRTITDFAERSRGLAFYFVVVIRSEEFDEQRNRLAGAASIDTERARSVRPNKGTVI